MLPLLYTFVGLWVALGLSNQYLNDSLWPIEERHLFETYFAFIVASVSFYLGLSVIRRKNNSLRVDVERIRLILSGLNGRTIIFLYASTVFVMHIAYPFQYLYFREGYLPIYGGSSVLKLLFNLMVFALSVVLPFYKSKLIRLLLFVFILLLVQGLNKRLIVLLPLLYFLGLYIRDSRFNYGAFLLLALSSLFFSGLAYEYRNNLSQGVVTNIVHFYHNGLSFDKMLEGVNYLFGFSFFSTLITSSFFEVKLIEFFISINPLPSNIIDVSSVTENHKITVFAPYSALGTLSALGIAYVSVYYFFVGLVFSFCKSYFPVRFSMASSIIFIFFMLFSMLTLQYQLRTATRFVYYAMFVFFVFKICSAIVFIARRKA